MEIPPSRIFTSGPKRRTAYRVQVSTSYRSFTPKVVVCPSLVQWARSSMSSTLSPIEMQASAPPQKSRDGVPRYPWQRMASGAPSRTR